jgi:hypothetical protein
VTGDGRLGTGRAAATYFRSVTVTAREWIERQRASHAKADEAEAERIRRMTPDERWELERALCRSAMEMLLALPEEARRKVLADRDPLPPSSDAALKRLRAEYAARHH